MQQHGSKYFARRQPPTLGMGSIGRNSTFSEYGHAAYEIKENQERSSMVANILSVDIPDPGDGVSRSKFYFFQNMVMVHIKLKSITTAATW